MRTRAEKVKCVNCPSDYARSWLIQRVCLTFMFENTRGLWNQACGRSIRILVYAEARSRRDRRDRAYGCEMVFVYPRTWGAKARAGWKRVNAKTRRGMLCARDARTAMVRCDVAQPLGIAIRNAAAVTIADHSEATARIAISWRVLRPESNLAPTLECILVLTPSVRIINTVLISLSRKRFILRHISFADSYLD